VPHSLRAQFSEENEVVTTHYQGWADYDDDKLLSAAESEFAVFVPLDTNLIHQQNVRSLDMAVVVIDIHPVLPSHLEKHMGTVNGALPIAAEGKGVVVVRDDGMDFLSP
jgi:hypothetical protein